MCSCCGYSGLPLGLIRGGFAQAPCELQLSDFCANAVGVRSARMAELIIA